jgi:hypothetical protein
MDRNKHIKDYLAYYIAFPHPPRFAVLLNGPWGIGKTFLLKSFLDALGNGEKNYVYVSLYGLTSLDDIDEALFRAMYPVLYTKGAKLAGRAAKAVARFLRVDMDVTAKDILEKPTADLFVFDDLERCEAPINKVLGYINEFVEHEGRKVIIVANEAEIGNGDEYRRRREKLIGKTLEVQSAFEEALAHFTSLVDHADARASLAAKTAEISSVYHQAELNNLRILQQTIWDFERFYAVLADKHRQNDRALTALLKMFFALSFELKAGRLASDHLMKRQEAVILAMVRSRGDEGTTPSALVTAQERYPDTDLTDSTLSDETLADMLVKGIVDETAIRAELDRSSYFVTVADEPAWRTVWHAFERTDAEFEAAFIKMERQFAAREIDEIGELLHVFGLRLWLSNVGVLARTRTQVVEEGKSYVDDLYAARRLKPESRRDDLRSLRSSGYDGLSIYEHETAEYRELYEYLREKRAAADLDRHPTQAAELLREMQTDPGLFFQRLNLTNSEDNRFYHIPILAALETDAFVMSFLAQHPLSQRTILLAIKTRHEGGHLDREVSTERPWLEEVRAKLIAASGAMSPIAAHRLRMNIKWNLDPILGTEGEAEPHSVAAE